MWFTWDPVNEDRIRKNFENRGNTRLRDFLGKVRKQNKKLAWLGDAQWKGLQQYWANEAYKKFLETAEKNRPGIPKNGGPSIHTCGSIAMHKYRRHLVTNFAMYFFNFNTLTHFECGLACVSYNSVWHIEGTT